MRKTDATPMMFGFADIKNKEKSPLTGMVIKQIFVI